MSGIRGKDTKPEMIVRKALHAAGLRFRLHGKDLPGKPDLVLPKYRAIIFVHGCFWHRHEGCRFATTPATRPEFWDEKFRKNIERDEKSIKELLESGWRIGIIWECTTRDQSPVEIAQATSDWLLGNVQYIEF